MTPGQSQEHIKIQQDAFEPGAVVECKVIDDHHDYRYHSIDVHAEDFTGFDFDGIAWRVTFPKKNPLEQLLRQQPRAANYDDLSGWAEDFSNWAERIPWDQIALKEEK